MVSYAPLNKKEDKTMANELALDKIRLRMNIPLVLETKVYKKFHHKNDKSGSEAFLRALFESVSDVILTPADYRKIAKRIEANRVTRLERRKARSQKVNATEGKEANS